MTFEKSILIVEDDGIIAMDIEEELTSRGWTSTRVASTVDAALDAIKAKLPDLAVLDMNLRGHYSYDLATKLRALGVPVVFLSGNTVADLPVDLRDCAFVQKPVNYDLLQNILAAAAQV